MHLQDLGKRLDEITEIVIKANKTIPFDQIWDCCCDHGYLGMALLRSFAEDTRQPHINFVDQVEHITFQLKSALTRHSVNTFSPNYTVLTQDVAELSLKSDQRHCLIIAGITANGLIGLLNKLLSNNRQQSIDFVLCPTRGIYDLREFLKGKNMQLIHEAYIVENNRHYEIVHVRFQATRGNQTSSKQVSSIGEFWQVDNNEHITYLKNRIAHFKKETNDTTRVSAKQALALYSEKLIDVNSGN